MEKFDIRGLQVKLAEPEIYFHDERLGGAPDILCGFLRDLHHLLEGEEVTAEEFADAYRGAMLKFVHDHDPTGAQFRIVAVVVIDILLAECGEEFGSAVRKCLPFG
ncbi:hypothetical protein HYW32_00385 [Candidatus Berkelbacteria bacterium]|nr:hypothetical protein [Candidatus Berkelbacteria bacterium]